MDPTRSNVLPISPALRAKQATDLKRRLGAFMQGQLQITVTDNRAVMVSVKRDARHRMFTLRVHHLFVAAPDHIIGALARYIELDDRAASAELHQYVDDNDHSIRHNQSRTDRRHALRTAGRVHNLKEIFDDVNQRYFGGGVNVQITWGRRIGQSRPRRSVKLGSFTVEEEIIRIHPGLDQEWVPRYYLEWVVYHEMLHALHPIPVVNGRRQFHTPAFLGDERLFGQYQEAVGWEKRNLTALLAI